MRRFGQKLASLLLLLLCGVCETGAERPMHIRAYRAAGSFSAAVSIAPGGSVVARSGDTPQLTILDGFTRRDLAMPEESHARVYQSRSGQFWSVAQEGLWLYHNSQWTLHPIAEIRSELANNIRPLRQISLIPAEVSRVLILLPDRLLDYDASSRVVRTIRSARQTGLGAFTEMQEGIDEAVWVAGNLGIARIPGPLRRIGPETEWSEHLLTATNEVNNLQRPFEFPAGQVTVSASRLESDARSVLRFRNNSWTSFLVPDEKVRQAWTGWDQAVWGFSFNSLFRLPENAPGALIREPVFGRQYDIALESGGAFWIGTSDGLVRYAPFLWHAPPEVDNLQTPVHAMLFADGERTNLWFAVPEGLLATSGKSSRIYRWPEELEAVGGRGRLFRLPNGNILIGTPGRPMMFSPKEGVFTPVSVSSDDPVRFVGQMSDGRPVAALDSDAGDLRLETFDGTNFVSVPLTEMSWKPGEVSFYQVLPDGEIWIGGSSGLLHIRTNQTSQVYGVAQGLPAERLNAVGLTADGRVWCGSDSRVVELRGQRWQTVLNTADRVQTILRAQDSVWVGTLSGIYRYFNESWIFYSANEGLSAPVFTLQKDAAEQLWAGTARGVARFYPSADVDAPHTIQPILDAATQPSTLEPTVIRFAGQDKWDYTAPGDLLYAYKLDETSWTPFSNVATRVFPNLSSGSHTLLVLAMDRNGNRAPEPAQIGFTVIVPWFKDPRLLFVSVVAGALTFVLAGFAVNKHLQLKKSYAEVEKIVAERTRELERANRELLHGQKMRAIGTMAAGIAHDFNNILSIIKGSAQIIESNPSDKDKIRTRVNRIQTVVEQGTTIVKALLGLGRMSEKDLSPCDITALLHETRRLLSDRFPDSVKLHIDAAPGLPSTVCAQEVLQQMLLNLILNAVDAIGNEGLVQLRATQSATLPPDLILEPAPSSAYITVSVVDEGVGISPENVTRIFEPFFTTKAFSSRRGTGLGLSMVYELAKGFGYGLALKTKAGEGSSFSIVLPVTSSNLSRPSWRQPSKVRVSNS